MCAEKLGVESRFLWLLPAKGPDATHTISANEEDAAQNIAGKGAHSSGTCCGMSATIHTGYVAYCTPRPAGSPADEDLKIESCPSVSTASQRELECDANLERAENQKATLCEEHRHASSALVDAGIFEHKYLQTGAEPYNKPEVGGHRGRSESRHAGHRGEGKEQKASQWVVSTEQGLRIET
eukprot:1156781-Pelagomonas_calceolata.AAC.8